MNSTEFIVDLDLFLNIKKIEDLEWFKKEIELLDRIDNEIIEIILDLCDNNSIIKNGINLSESNINLETNPSNCIEIFVEFLDKFYTSEIEQGSSIVLKDTISKTKITWIWEGYEGYSIYREDDEDWIDIYSDDDWSED